MTTRARRKLTPLPPLPATISTAHGMVPVELVTDLRDPEEPSKQLFGMWNSFTRVISIRAGLHPTAAWLTLYHEKTHADLSEVGVKIPDELEEVICNAISAARLAELKETL